MKKMWVPREGEKIIIPKGIPVRNHKLPLYPRTNRDKRAGTTYKVTTYVTFRDHDTKEGRVAWKSRKGVCSARLEDVKQMPTDLELLSRVPLTNPHSKWVPRVGEKVLVPKGTRNVRVYEVDAWRGKWAVDEYHAPRDLIVMAREVSYASAGYMGFAPPADVDRVTHSVGDDRIRMVFWGRGARERRAMLKDVKPVPTDLELLSRVPLDNPRRRR